ncbi:hypothetical protein AB0K51_05230 [Kitasatospora sp. NPDC049285]|uniref:hypothetical protein n=1 Tax=Kitasatospora sp. NPDC049285 TaxID=3157096 RepID=UPI00343B42FA
MSLPHGGAPPIHEPSRYGGGSYLALAAPLLAPGEQVRGIVDADLGDLIRRVPRKYRSRNLALGTELALGAVSTAFDLIGSFAEVVEDCTWGLIRSLRRLVRGRGLTGGWTSQAGRFVITVRAGGHWDGGYSNDDVLLVLTDRRILLAHESRGALTALGDLPYPQLRRIENRHTWLSNRVDLHFADGSLAALEVSSTETAALQALGPR